MLGVFDFVFWPIFSSTPFRHNWKDGDFVRLNENLNLARETASKFISAFTLQRGKKVPTQAMATVMNDERRALCVRIHGESNEP